MTNLSLTPILFVSILLEEVKIFYFVFKSAWVIVELVEFAICVSISTPSINNELQLILLISTFIVVTLPIKMLY